MMFKDLALAAILVTGASMARADTILFSGNTTASTPSTIGPYLTFTPSTFTNVAVPIGGAPTSLTNLGTFQLLVCGSNGCSEDFGTQGGASEFTLKLGFTDPTVAGTPQLFTADVFGTITRSGNSDNIGNGSLLTIDFDNTLQHLFFTTPLGSGAFDLSVNDPDAYTAASRFGDTRTVTGQISNLAFTANPATTAATAPVPEPSSIALFGVVAAFAGVVYRRRSRTGQI